MARKRKAVAGSALWPTCDRSCRSCVYWDVSTTRTASTAAQEAFCGAHLAPLAAALTLYTGDSGIGEELAQETLLRALARWERTRDLTSPRAWLYRVGVNLASSHFRRRAAERRALRRHGPPVDELPEPDPADALAVRQAVGRLPAVQRRVLVLRHVGGLSVPETATALRLTESAVRSHAYRATRTLRAVLGQSDIEEVVDRGW